MFCGCFPCLTKVSARNISLLYYVKMLVVSQFRIMYHFSIFFLPSKLLSMPSNKHLEEQTYITDIWHMVMSCLKEQVRLRCWCLSRSRPGLESWPKYRPPVYTSININRWFIAPIFVISEVSQDKQYLSRGLGFLLYSKKGRP